MSEDEWNGAQSRARKTAEAARELAEARPVASPATVTRHVFFDGDMQEMGGQLNHGFIPPATTEAPQAEGRRINMVTAIRRTLDHELTVNDRVVVFGQDVGPKGGVHSVTLGLQEKFGDARVFDTSLSEEGIVGRAVGMSLAGLMPVPEIQFRKYAEPATEQINDCGTIRCAPTTGSQPPWCSGCPVASSNAVTRGTVRPTKSPSSTNRVGRLRCPRMRRTQSVC